MILPAGGCRLPASAETVQNEQHYIQMAGNEVFKHAVRRMEGACKECLEERGISESDISWLIPHQANLRIIDAIAKAIRTFAARADYQDNPQIWKYIGSTILIALDEFVNRNR